MLLILIISSAVFLPPLLLLMLWTVGVWRDRHSTDDDKAASAFVTFFGGAIDDDKAASAFVTFFGGAMLLATPLVFLCLLLSAQYSNQIQVADFQTFAEDNLLVYRDALTETEYLLSDEDVRGVLLVGSIEKIGIGKETADRITDLRDAIGPYNQAIRRYEATRSHWWWWTVRKPLPENVKPIHLVRE